ncbi:MAG: DUF3043 domain-containing protein [Actinomycetes bacterium]
MTEEMPTGKGRPTPKRSEVEAKRKKSSIAPANSKEARKAARDQTKIERMAQRAAYLRGDERAMPPRDKGPVRKLARDMVDSRRSVGEYFLPVVLIVLALSSFRAMQVYASLFLYAVLLGVIVDGALLARRIKKVASERFPAEPLKGITLYAWLRSTQLRRLRTPPAMIARGTKI